MSSCTCYRASARTPGAGGRSCWLGSRGCASSAARPSLSEPSRSITSSRWPSPSPDSSKSCRPCAWSVIEPRRAWRATIAPPWRAAFVATSTRTTPQRPRLPPLVFQLQKWDLDRPCQGIDVCRCRKNGLANARFPLPVFCPLDCILPTEEGQLADLMWVEMPCDHRKGVLDRLPFVGKGWYAKPVCAYLLEAGLAQWQHFKWSLDATAHVDQRCLELVLERMEQNCMAGGRGALRQAGHQQPRGLVCSESGIGILHEDFQPPGGRRGLQLAPDLHGFGRKNPLGSHLCDGAALQQQLPADT